MKLALFLLASCLVVCLVSALDNRTGHRLVNRPKFDIYGPRQRRSPNEGAKGGIRVHPLFQFPKRKQEVSLRKGEYQCGDKVCKLQPGQKPKGCNGICQYPVL